MSAASTALSSLSLSLRTTQSLLLAGIEDFHTCNSSGSGCRVLLIKRSTADDSTIRLYAQTSPLRTLIDVCSMSFRVWPTLKHPYRSWGRKNQRRATGSLHRLTDYKSFTSMIADIMTLLTAYSIPTSALARIRSTVNLTVSRAVTTGYLISLKRAKFIRRGHGGMTLHSGLEQDTGFIGSMERLAPANRR